MGFLWPKARGGCGRLCGGAGLCPLPHHLCHRSHRPREVRHPQPTPTARGRAPAMLRPSPGWRDVAHVATAPLRVGRFSTSGAQSAGYQVTGHPRGWRASMGSALQPPWPCPATRVPALGHPPSSSAGSTFLCTSQGLGPQAASSGDRSGHEDCPTYTYFVSSPHSHCFLFYMVHNKCV